jgi:hypothetical protein
MYSRRSRGPSNSLNLKLRDSGFGSIEGIITEMIFVGKKKFTQRAQSKEKITKGRKRVFVR